MQLLLVEKDNGTLASCASAEGDTENNINININIIIILTKIHEIEMGNFYLWGSGYSTSWLPTLININENFKAINCALGENHVLVSGVSREGVNEVYSWGSGTLGQVRFI